MPKASCVEYPAGHDFVTIRTPVVDLFDGDHCCAALVSFFEWKTNAQLGLRDSGLPDFNSNDPAWVKASIPQIFEETTRLYSLRSLTDRLEFLRVNRIIEVADAEVGSVRRYLFDYRRVSALIKAHRVLPYSTPISKIADAPSADPSAEPSAKTATLLPMLNNVIDSQTSDSIQTSCSPPADFETLMHRWKQHRGFKKPTKPEREQAQEKWKMVALPAPELDAALDGYYASDFGRREHYPIRGFLKDPTSWIEPTTTIHPAPSSASVLLPEGGATSSTSAETPANAPGASNCEIVFVGQLPAEAVMWNSDVLSGPPVENWSTRSAAHRNLLDRKKEPGFNEAYPGLLKKIQRLCSCGKNFSLGWLLKEGNWLKLVNGEFDWAIKGATASQKSREALALLEK